MATTGNGLLEPGNISTYQRSKMKVRNVELAISVGQRYLPVTNGWFQLVQRVARQRAFETFADAARSVH